MSQHLFLTGEKGVGKSTLLKKLLEKDTRALGGFFTVKASDVFPGRVSLHLLRAGTADTPSPENFLFFCKTKNGSIVERFERLGCNALRDSQGAQLLVMDELGPTEFHAEAFKTAVLKALDEDIPIIGVLQKASSPFLQQIAAHPNVRVIEITKENRDHIQL